MVERWSRRLRSSKLLNALRLPSGIGRRKRRLEQLRQLQHQSEIALERQKAEAAETRQTINRLREDLAASRAESDFERNRFKEFFDFAPDGYLMTDLAGRIREANPMACQLLKTTRESLSNRLFTSFIVPEDQPRLARLLNHHDLPAERSQKIEAGVHPRAGPNLACTIAVTPVSDMRGQVSALRWILRDITERNRIQSELLRQNQRLALLNQCAERLLRTTDSEKAIEAIYAGLASYFQVDAVFHFDLRWDSRELELVYYKTSKPAAGDCVGARLKLGEGACGLAAQDRKVVALENVQESNDPSAQVIRNLGGRAYVCHPLIVGDKLLGTLSFASARRDSFGRLDFEFFQSIANYLALAKERARLRAELRSHAEGLEKLVGERTSSLQEAVAELEHFSYSLVHDMRAPLRAMEGFAQMLIAEPDTHLGERGRGFLQRLIAAVHRMDALITDALQYSSAVRRQLPLTPVAPEALLRGMMETFPEFQPPRADIRVEGPLPRVLANEAGLGQCFSNLLGNAVKFVAPGVQPKVRIRAERLPGAAAPAEHPAEATANPSASPKGGGEARSLVRLWFEDNGIGVPEEHRDRIFGMFQRIHTNYEGTGIGLALVRKVIERMGGSVGVEPNPGGGSRFWLQLQAADN